jgi:hypothetical protein
MHTRTFALVMALALAACSEGESDDRLPVAGPELAMAQTGGSPSAANPPAAPDLTGTMVLESAAGCRFDALTNHALEGLVLLSDWEPFTMRSVPQEFVGDLTLTPELTREAEPTGYMDEERTIYTARAPFPAETAWHGLHPTALHGYYVSNPESDHYEERGVVFAETAQQLFDWLKAMGQEVPLSPESMEITDYGPYSGAGCGAGIQIRPEGEGSVLACGYGC